MAPDQSYSASAAFAFGASFFRAGQALGTQEIQQGTVSGKVGRRYRALVNRELHRFPAERRGPQTMLRILRWRGKAWQVQGKGGCHARGKLIPWRSKLCDVVIFFFVLAQRLRWRWPQAAALSGRIAISQPGNRSMRARVLHGMAMPSSAFSFIGASTRCRRMSHRQIEGRDDVCRVVLELTQ